SDTQRVQPTPAPGPPPVALDLDCEEVPAVVEPPVVLSSPSAVNLVLDTPTAGSTVVPDEVQAPQEEEEDEVAGPPPMVIQDENGNAPVDYHLTMVPFELTLMSRGKLRTLAMVDSGCGASFVDRRFAAQHKIPLSRLEVPLEAEAIDGHRVVPISHQTAELTFAVGGKRFKMRFHVMDCPHADF
ncbi:hypothetical protein BC828DRAFT_409515, partial [Blastocladiella britannica]